MTTELIEVVAERGNEVALSQTAALPKMLEGDQLRLKQILINLVKNALKFTMGGAIQIVAAYDYAK